MHISDSNVGLKFNTSLVELLQKKYEEMKSSHGQASRLSTTQVVAIGAGCFLFDFIFLFAGLLYCVKFRRRPADT